MQYTNKIDFQAHYLPPSYYEFLESENLEMPDGFMTPEWNETIQKEGMEALGIGFALLTLSSPSLYTKDKMKTCTFARKVNEEGAMIAAKDPEHLGFIATLPLPYVEESISEAIFSLEALKADGIGLMTNYGGIYLGDERFEPLLEELNKRKALVILHPTEPGVEVPNVCEGLCIPAMEYFFETTRTFSNMVLKEVFNRYPDIKWVLPHAGAFLSILADRFESFAVLLRFADPNLDVDIMKSMQHVYYDVAGFSEQKQIEMLLQNVDVSHLLYGSDTPYTPIEACIGQTEALENTNKLTALEKDMIFTQNALELVPRLKDIPYLAARKNAVKVDGRFKSLIKSLLKKKEHTALKEEKREQTSKVLEAQEYEIKVETPVGEIKAFVDIAITGKETFTGQTKIMGKQCILSNGKIKEGNIFMFDVVVALPFGKLKLDIEVKIDDEGKVTGEACAPKRKAMPITGCRLV